MALEREKTNVAIGNMPYVRPTNAIGNFAQKVQQDAIQERDRIFAEENAQTVAESVALIYDKAKRIEIDQAGVPNSLAMSKELGGYARKISRLHNPDVQRALGIKIPGILSPIVNKTVDKEVIYNINQNVLAIRNEVEEARRVTADNIDNNFANKEFQEEYYKNLADLQKRLQTSSQGTIPQENIDKEFSAQRIEFATQITARQYAEIAKTRGRTEAEKMLTARAKDFADQFVSKGNFEKIVKGVLDQTDLRGNIRKSHMKYILDFEKLSFDDRRKKLSEAEAFLHPALFEKLQEKHADEILMEKFSDQKQGFESLVLENRNTWLTIKNIEEFFDTHKESFRGKNRQFLAGLRTREIRKFYDDKTREEANRISNAQIRLEVEEMQSLLDAAKRGDIKDSPTSFSNGVPLKKSHVKAIQTEIVSRIKGLDNHVQIINGVKPITNADKNFWEKEQGYKVALAMENNVLKDPLATSKFFRDNVMQWARYRKLPDAIIDLFNINKDAETLKSMAKLKQDIEEYNRSKANNGEEIVLPQDMKLNALFDIITPAMNVEEINEIKAKIFSPQYKGDANKAISEAQALVTMKDENGANLVQTVLHELGPDGIIANFGYGVFNSLLGHSKTGAYDFFAEMNSSLRLVTEGQTRVGFYAALTSGLDSQQISYTEAAQRQIAQAATVEFIKFDKNQIDSKSAIKTVLNKLGHDKGTLGFSYNMYQKDQKSLYVHALPPEQVLKDARGVQISGKQIAIAMIENADQLLRLIDANSTNQTMSERLYPGTSQYRRGKNDAIDGKGELDLALLYKAGRLKLINGQQLSNPDGTMRTSYEMVVIDSRDQLQKLFIPGKGTRIDFTKAFEIEATDASSKMFRRGNKVEGDSGQRLDAISKSLPTDADRGFGLTINPNNRMTQNE